MLNQPSSFWIIFSGSFACIIVGIGFLAYGYNLKTNWCSQRNGILVKSSEGWTCIDVKVIK